MQKQIGIGVATGVVLIASVVVQGVRAQHVGNHAPSNSPVHGAPTAAPGGPFAVTAFGAFRRMMHMQDFTAKARLAETVAAGFTEAVGAVEGLRGEITMVDGKLLVSYGKPCPSCAAPDAETATLLAVGRVTSWMPGIELPRDLSGAALDAFIVEKAREAGLDLDHGFPIRMAGPLIDVKMHVLSAANPQFKGHGSGHAMAEQQDIAATRIEGVVVGFYAPLALQGVITHPGDAFHYHWVDTARTRTAHLDTFGMARGALLMLPGK